MKGFGWKKIVLFLMAVGFVLLFYKLIMAGLS